MEHGNGSREGEVVDTHYTYRCYIIVALRSCDISWFCVCVCVWLMLQLMIDWCLRMAKPIICLYHRLHQVARSK